MMFAFVARHRRIWPLSWMCEVPGVSRSGFHAWLKRPVRNRAALDAKLVIAIDRSFKASDRTYGARRVWREVLAEGLSCGLHREDGERSVFADNVLDRDFEAGQEMAGRLHLLLNRRGLAVCCGRAGPVLSPHRGLVHESGSRRRAGHGCIQGPSYANLTRCPRNRQQAATIARLPQLRLPNRQISRHSGVQSPSGPPSSADGPCHSVNC